MNAFHVGILSRFRVNCSAADIHPTVDARTDARNQITNKSSAMPRPENGRCHDGVLLLKSQQISISSNQIVGL
jgi:hypothetical protein